MAKSNPIVLLTLVLGAVLFGSVVFLLITWRDIDAVLSVIISVPILLRAMALAATWIPAVRASRLDPMKALGID
jgi:ABC-type lipoprotein release transport system permease subunit